MSAATENGLYVIYAPGPVAGNGGRPIHPMIRAIGDGDRTMSRAGHNPEIAVPSSWY